MWYWYLAHGPMGLFNLNLRCGNTIRRSFTVSINGIFTLSQIIAFLNIRVDEDECTLYEESLQQ